jgi:hypothetical protein
VDIQVAYLDSAKGEHLEALVFVLARAPADKRQELIARALEQIGQKEERAALLKKLENATPPDCAAGRRSRA